MLLWCGCLNDVEAAWWLAALGWDKSRLMANRPEVSGASAEIIRTKLLAPTLRSAYIARPRLFKVLEASSDRKLTLLSAPTGYGKTTLQMRRFTRTVVNRPRYGLNEPREQFR